MKKILISLVFLFALGTYVFSQSENAPIPTLDNPYNTMYVHLYYLQPENYRPDIAAVTLSRTKDSLELIKDAIKLKQIFDGNGLFVRLNQLPQEPDFKDSLSQKFYFTPFPAELPDVYLERINGKWLFSKETVGMISKLHKKTYPLGTDQLLTLLPKMGQQRFLGLATWQYLTILLIILLGWVFHKISSSILRPIVKRLFSTYLNFALLDNKNVLKVAQAISMLFLFWILRILLPVLQLPISAAEKGLLILNIVMTVFAVVLAVRIIKLVMEYAMEYALGTEHRMDEQLIPIIRRSLILLFSIIGTFHILHLLNVNITALIAGVSIGGLALALAAQDTVKNLIGSAMIFFDRPFQIGDYIIGGDAEGTVVEVGFRTTRIQQIDTSIISVPNGTIANIAITNLGVRVFRLLSTTLTITYDTPPNLIEKFIEGLKKIILTHPLTRKEDFLVHFTAFDSSSLNIMFRTHLEVNTFGDEMKAKEDILFGILRLAESLNVSFAFPSSTIYINNDATNDEKDNADIDGKIETFLEDFKRKNTPPEDFLD